LNGLLTDFEMLSELYENEQAAKHATSAASNRASAERVRERGWRSTMGVAPHDPGLGPGLAL
jgi:hypothetical protein